MTTEQIRCILQTEYGINNESEFEEALKKNPGINTGIFTMPFKRRRKDEPGNSNNRRLSRYA